MTDRLKNAAIYVAIFLVCALLGFLAFDRVLMPTVIGSGKAYPIPNLVGMDVDSAAQVAKQEGFRFKVVREEFSTLVPAHRIVNQIPQSGTLAKKGRTIRVVVSKGGLKAVVPNVVNKLLRQAELALEDARLVVGEVESVFCDSVQPGFVISVSPPPGETLAAGDKVKLVVSRGSETGTVAVPNLVGMKLDDALKTLDHIGLKAKIVRRRIPTIQDSMVFKQEPQQGTLLYRGNVVAIMVNFLE